MILISFVLFTLLFLYCQKIPVISGDGDSKINPQFLMTDASIQTKFNTYDMVWINFYVDWCPYSKALQPTFHAVAENVFAGELEKSKRLALVFLDCESEKKLCQIFGVNKYPTLRLYRFRVPAVEYRGGRSKEDLQAYVDAQVKDAVVYHIEKAMASNPRTFEYSANKHYIIGYLQLDQNKQPQNPYLPTFQKVAMALRDSCEFIHTDLEPDEHHVNASNNRNVIKFHLGEMVNETLFQGDINSTESLLEWALEICQPIVSELTFKNAEEFIERGMPLLVFFHSPEDGETPYLFRQMCRENMKQYRGQVSFVTADANVFRHPMKHFAKTHEDLPLIAADTFEHVFLYPGSVKEALKNVTLLHEFIKKLVSGDLHDEFHAAEKAHAAQTGDNKKTPLKSVFVNLGPSRNRYSFPARDEL